MRRIKKIQEQPKRQVKLMLPEGVYQKLVREAQAEGLSLAAYVRKMIMVAERLQGAQKNVKIKREILGNEERVFARVKNIF